jgi:tripartite-type tricarboxylate transporter receptor subunit TctC
LKIQRACAALAALACIALAAPAIGTANVARAAPDGNTLLFAASSHNLTALLAANAAYDPIKDFAAVANVGMQSYVLMASAQLPVRTLAELVRHAKAHPGTLNYASAGHGSSSHLAMAYFERMLAAMDEAGIAKSALVQASTC